MFSNENNLGFHARYHFFDDYPGFQPKITHTKHFSRQCNTCSWRPCKKVIPAGLIWGNKVVFFLMYIFKTSLIIFTDYELSSPIFVQWVTFPCFPLFNHYFYKKPSLYIHIQNIYFGSRFEFGRQRIRDLAFMCP